MIPLLLIPRRRSGFGFCLLQVNCFVVSKESPALNPNDSDRSAHVAGGASGAGQGAAAAKADLGCYQVCLEGGQPNDRWS